MLFSTHYKTDIDNYLMSETQSIVRKRLQAEQMFKRDRESISNIEEHCKKRAVIDVLAGVLAQKRAVVDSAEAAMLNDIKIFDAAVLLLREYVFDKAKSSVASSSSVAQFQIKINMFGGTTA
jgi:dihydroxyacid dehydratase/phosphogluconate dehydratase